MTIAKQFSDMSSTKYLVNKAIQQWFSTPTMRLNHYIMALLTICLFTLSSCDTNTILKENYDIPDAKWFIKDAPTFTFEVKDSVSAYNVFYTIRNNRSYPYYNLYLTHYLTTETGKIIHQKLDEVILFDQTSGRSLGEGLGDIYDHKVLVFKDFHFPKNGKYKIQIRQYMRQDPLLDIISAGFSIEKVVAH
ncbi:MULTISPECIES: gliding motility lipoprotein GldH [unclassified Arcicella]|uniref:gliding motility lipoprotein GldH n=1 Tax=unclassified Arcicella TaxID=2644986 RepID=UPI00285976FF|nr:MULTISPECIES: gliding motility lipoprotein GldH [unclassified Arcicella]MDR6563401.1 gliding motility-associated lipoprotein GldH [Arcicella sp. BE51]MDR6813178.1 gliding motility-associated lipoprotein GldH [Arcicella sp. BE140]MDR6824492.1 gliding motility-associated lipoprotein GldH [Arcicella sp. BE139]